MEKNPLHDILIRTCSDKAFRQEFLKNPAEVLRRAAILVPAGVTVKVLENTDEEIHIVLPTSIEEQPANWACNERPAPGEERETPTLLLRWTEEGLVLSGRIGVESAPLLRQELDRANGNLLIDFRQVDFMSSAGLGVLLAAQKRLAAAHKTLYLCDVPVPIQNLFSLSGMDTFFKFVKSEPDNWFMAFPPI